MKINAAIAFLLLGLAGPQAALAAPGPTFVELTPAPLPHRPATNRLEGVPSPSPTNAPATHSPVATNAFPGAAAMNALDDKHRLAIGDKLSFRIEEEQGDPKPLIVTDSGDVEVPYIGRYPAEDKTCKQLAWELKAALEKEYFYQATVILAVDSMSKTRGRVYLVGPVRAPGPQEIPSDEILTLSKAILRAGGFTDFADRHEVKVTRKVGAQNKTFVVDVGQIFDKGRTDLDLPLEPGDLIMIPERLIRF